jgi:WD40 repeat protein
MPEFRSLCRLSVLLLGLVAAGGCQNETGGESAMQNSRPPLNAVAVSPDGRSIACCYRGNPLLIRDAKTLKTIHTLTFGDDDRVHPKVARFRPSGQELLVGYVNGTVGIWDLQAPHAKPAILGRHNADVRCAAVSSDGRVAATGDGLGTVLLFDLRTRVRNYRTIHHGSPLWCVAFSADNRHLATAGSSGLIRIWELATGRESRVLNAHRGVVRQLHFTATSGRLLSAGHDGMLRLWNLELGRPIWDVKVDSNGINGFACSPSERTVAVAAIFSGDIELRDLETGRQLSSIPAERLMVNDLAFVSETVVVSAGMDGDAKRWTVPSNGPPASAEPTVTSRRKSGPLPSPAAVILE